MSNYIPYLTANGYQIYNEYSNFTNINKEYIETNYHFICNLMMKHPKFLNEINNFFLEHSYFKHKNIIYILYYNTHDIYIRIE